jgi:hypothetical protein
MERIAALLNVEDVCHAWAFAERLALIMAQEMVKGNTGVMCAKSELKDAIKNNKEFFDSLCEKGVIEWLRPFVMARGK